MLYFLWVPLRPEPVHEWTCPYQAAQGTGSGVEESQAGAYLSDTLLLSPVGQGNATLLPPNSYQGR